MSSTYTNKQTLKLAGGQYAKENPIWITDGIEFNQNAEECFCKVRFLSNINKLISALLVLATFKIFCVTYSISLYELLTVLPVTSLVAIVTLEVLYWNLASSFIKTDKKNVILMADQWKPIRKTLVRELSFAKVEKDSEGDFSQSLVNWLKNRVFLGIAKSILVRQKFGEPECEKLKQRKAEAGFMLGDTFIKTEMDRHWSEPFKRAIEEIKNGSSKEACLIKLTCPGEVRD